MIGWVYNLDLYLSQIFLLRAAGFLLPCYIMAWAISILQRRRQRQVGYLGALWVYFQILLLKTGFQTKFLKIKEWFGNWKEIFLLFVFYFHVSF